MPYRGFIGTTDGLLDTFISDPVNYHYGNSRHYSMHTCNFKRKTAALAAVSDIKNIILHLRHPHTVPGNR